jgi:hypothetical protein
MNNALMVEEHKPHTNVLNDLQLLRLLKPTICQTSRVVLNVDFAITKRHDVVVAVILSKVRANSVSDEIEKIKLVS